VGNCGLYSSGSGYGLVIICREHGNEISSSVEEILD
jgi:hypothetical protein